MMLAMQEWRVTEGRPWPLGVFAENGGVYFALFSRHATAVHLLLFEGEHDTEASREIELTPRTHRTGDVWHCFVEGCPAGALYLYRVSGPYDPESGHRFNDSLAVLDPYARALTHCEGIGRSLGYDPDAGRRDMVASRKSNLDVLPKCIVVDTSFDWQGDRPLNHLDERSIIYEAHVRGMTANASSGVEHPGTYRGVIEHIPYLKRLGITTLELLPVHEFDSTDNVRRNPFTGKRLANYWGYNTIAFFAPKKSYAAARGPAAEVVEFKEMVRELHKANIEVVLDVVFNHTGEGSEIGPTVSFRGIDNRLYYMLDENRRYYKNFSGCGNTLNCNHPIVRSLILDSLRYWVVHMHVDGFRFDLGSILARDDDGSLMDRPPMLERIAEDPVLRDTKIIAEAWDAGGAYQVGSFFGGRWAEWNDRFRDDVRRFWRGDPWVLGNFATRVAGSSDLYAGDGRKPFHSVNFVTCHDGFTLNDLVTYERRHNRENGEGGRDGHRENFSYNYGVEGESSLPGVKRIRERQVRNIFLSLIVSQGVPMIRAGDELRHTQRGNNNAYCQDNGISWLNYERDAEKSSLFEFCAQAIRFRLRHPALLRNDFFTGKDGNGNRQNDVTWLSCSGDPVDWSYADGCLGVHIDGSDMPAGSEESDDGILVLFNATTVDTSFHLPRPRNGWRLVVDTIGGSSTRFRGPGEEEPWHDSVYRIAARSAVLFIDPL
ncbi:MAG: glycogen debranching protein GlgX [Spirochaetota bacterium]